MFQNTVKLVSLGDAKLFKTRCACELKVLCKGLKTSCCSYRLKRYLAFEGENQLKTCRELTDIIIGFGVIQREKTKNIFIQRDQISKVKTNLYYFFVNAKKPTVTE